MALNVKPIGDRILVEAVEEKELRRGGIIIPDTAKEKHQWKAGSWPSAPVNG
jgi:chaperonin GroES